MPVGITILVEELVAACGQAHQRTQEGGRHRRIRQTGWTLGGLRC